MLPTTHIPKFFALLFILSGKKETASEVRKNFHPTIVEFEYHSRNTGFDQLIEKPDLHHLNITGIVIVFVHEILTEDSDLADIEFRKLKSAVFNKKPNVSAVIRVNWSAVSESRNYYSILNVYGNQIANTVTAELEWLIDTHAVDVGKIVIIGQGYGGKIAGQIGRTLKRNGNEIGLIIGSSKLFLKFVNYSSLK